MKEKPILFSAPMVRAILDGRKTMTRRVVKLTDSGRVKAVGSPRNWHIDDPNAVLACPYGAPCDRLWVRERMRVIGRGPITRRADMIRVRYEADGTESELLPYPERLQGDPIIGKCLTYGGYREASRIDLEVTGVRVERVQDISDKDIIAEGVYIRINKDSIVDGKGHPLIRVTGDYPPIKYLPKHNGKGWSESELLRAEFAALWDSINAKRGYGWKVNPWVWVVEFRRI